MLISSTASTPGESRRATARAGDCRSPPGSFSGTLLEPSRLGVAALQERPLKPTEIAVGCAHDEVGIAVAVPIGDRHAATIGNERHVEGLARSKAADLTSAPDEEPAPSESAVATRLRALREQGKSGSAASRQVARELGISKSLVYQIWISLDERTTNDE